MDADKLNTLVQADADHHLHPNTNPRAVVAEGAMVVTRGDGIRITDEQGKSYIEGLAGLWCCSLGFSEERLARAAAQQMRTLPYYHSFVGRVPEPTARLAHALAQVTPDPITRFFFASSGSEANDTAIKMAWYYNNALGRPHKKKIISRLNSYHGLTLATASLTRLKAHQNGFDVPQEGFIQTDCPHFPSFALEGENEEQFVDRLATNLERTILEEGPDTIAAFFAEPVQGAGGIIVPPRGYFERIQPILRKYDILFVVDEVICGFGRTGRMFGSDTFGLVPDIMTMAKGLSAGYQPISAVGLSDEVYQAIADLGDANGSFGHGFTYGGHPVATAVSLETLRIYQERDIVGHVQSVSPHFQQRLAGFLEHDMVGEVRGVGLLGAIDLVADKGRNKGFDPSLAVGNLVLAKAMSRGLLFRAAANTLLFCPPLIVSESDIDQIFDIVAEALGEVREDLRDR